MSGPLLDARGVTVSYGGVRANDQIDLSIDVGQFVGLIGANGAGKTTLIDALSGFTGLSSGSICLDGDEISGETPERRSRRGLTRTFQSLELFEDLTVLDNLLVPCEDTSWRSFGRALVRSRPAKAAQDTVTWALETAGITGLRSRLPNQLSNGQRKLVALARALASRPRLLLLDEPAAGLDSDESRDLGTVLRGLLDHGVTVLLVEHDISLVLSVCDEVNVLNFGQILARGTPAEIRHDPKVIAAYLGTGAAAMSLDGSHGR